MFFIEGLSKLYTLVLVSFVCTFTYGQQGHDYYAGSLEENCLVVMLIAQVFYEFGQLASCGWSLSDYFGGLWNILDVLSCLLLMFWMVLLPFPDHFYIAKGSVALSAIPLALLQLQYMSLIKTLGLLVLMIQSMMYDVLTFIVVYLVSIYGFTVSFRALFYTVNDYSSTGTTFVTLFQSTLGEFTFANFDNIYKTVGTILLVLFLILTNVLLVNLLIAQFSSTYNRIITKSREEWTFIKAMYVQDNLLLNEKNPFCMLPPPLNVFTIVLYPLHVWALRNLNISVAGTAADYILGFYLIVPRFIFYWWKAVEAAFIDLEDDDDDYQERYQTVMKLLVMVLGKKVTQVLVLISCLPFGFIYVIVSTIVRIFHVVVRVKPFDEDGDGSYEINFYLDGEDDEVSDAGDNVNNKMVRSNSLKYAPKEDPDKPYTFADALPDAFEPTPDQIPEEDEPEDEDPDYPERAKRKQTESKGAKRIKKALNAKQSFMIDTDAFEDPSNVPTAPNVRRLNRAVLPKLTSKSSFYEKGDPEGTNHVGKRQSMSLFDIAGMISKENKDNKDQKEGNKRMSPKTSFNLNDGLSKLLPKTSFTLSDGGSARNHEASPGIGYGHHKTLSKYPESNKNESRNNSSSNLLRNITSAFSGNNTSNYSTASSNNRPSYSAMNSVDFIPTGFDDEDFLPSTQNSVKQSNTPTPDTSAHNTVSLHKAVSIGSNSMSSPDKDSNLIVSDQPLFRFNMPPIDTNHADKRISPETTARSQVSQEDTGIQTSRTNNSHITSEGVHSFDENDVLPDPQRKKPVMPIVATHFAGKLLHKMKQKATSAVQHVHLPHSAPARDHNLSPSSDDYHHDYHTDGDESSYDSDGNKKEKKKHKPAMFELFGMKKTHHKPHHDHHVDHFVPPDSYSDGEEQTPHFAAPPQRIVKASSAANHSNTTHNYPNRRLSLNNHGTHGNRERTHSTSSAISGRDTPLDSTGTPSESGPGSSLVPSGNESGVSKLFGLVTKAMSPSNRHSTRVEHENDVTVDHTPDENEPVNRRHSQGNANNGNLISTIGDIFTTGKKPPRRGSATSEVANSEQHTDNADEPFGTGHEDLEYHSSETESYDEESTIDTDSQGDSQFNPEEGLEEDPNDPNNTAVTAVKKGNVLFTPEDILRMFPANENEQNKLEIEEEIRKLKVSSEKAVAEATAEMKNDFQLRLLEAMNEIRSLREALTGVPYVPLEGEKGNNSSHEKMKRLASKKSFANTSGGDLTNTDTRATKKDSFHVSRKSSRAKMDTMSSVAATTSIAHNIAVKGKKHKDGMSRPNSAQSLHGRTHSNNSLKDSLHNRKSSRSPLPEGEISPDKQSNGTDSVVESPDAVVSPVPLFPTKQLPKWPPPPTPPTPSKPVIIPRGDNTSNTATVSNEGEVQQLKSDLQCLQGDMSEIKKMLGSILGKM